MSEVPMYGGRLALKFVSCSVAACALKTASVRNIGTTRTRQRDYDCGRMLQGASCRSSLGQDASCRKRSRVGVLETRSEEGPYLRLIDFCITQPQA